MSLRLTDDVEKDIAEAVKETGLSKQDVALLSLARGLPILRAQLKSPVPAGT